VLTQAVMNVTRKGKDKERYAVIPDEVIRYAFGKFGRPNIPIAPAVMDRIDSLPRARELQNDPGMPPLPELRRRIGPELSDEEFLLRATMPAEQVDAMKPLGAAPRMYDPEMVPVKNLIHQLAARRDIAYISVQKAGFSLELSTGAAGDAGA
jgi:oxaloacetate decarboxylase (Na+ extruding) subunit alpha